MNLETDNPEKGQLLQRSARHREQLEEEVKLISERSEKIITNALIIGGALALTYFLVTGLSGSSEKKKSKARKIKLVESSEKNNPAIDSDDEPEQAGVISQIGAVLVAQATGFLLSIAREKLVEFLQSQGVKKENTNEHP
ncbi:MAG: hypothetical protein WD824_07020 [Cyclobacteriaceae bacterium]